MRARGACDRQRSGTGRIAAAVAFVGSLIATAALLAPAGAIAAPAPQAVVMVSGYTTTTPFTTPDASCVGKEGATWDEPEGPARVLKENGYAVFTAPINDGTGPIPLPCTGAGEASPDGSMVINSIGDVDDNGAALGRLVAFLHDEYDTDTVWLVGHSDGGLWSRAALTQSALYPGVEVRSLTTLGTPHTGAFTADVGIAFGHSTCDFSSKVIRAACEFMRELARIQMFDGDNVAGKQLTNDFMATWNPQQEMGSCPVTGIAGTYLSLPLLFEYYTPSDGAVGQASALAERSHDIFFHEIPAAGIPDFRSGGTYPVVHSETLSFMSAKTLLNQEAISDRVVQSIEAADGGGDPCNAATLPGDGVDERVTQRVPLHVVTAPSRKRTLPAPDAGDFVIVRRGVTVRCGRSGPLQAAPLMEMRKLRVALAAGCEKRLRVRSRRGNAAARKGAMLLSEHPAGDVKVKLDPQGRVAARIRGRRLSRPVVQVRLADGKWERRNLRKGRARVPKGTEQVDVRIRASAPSGRRITGTASLSR